MSVIGLFAILFSLFFKRVHVYHGRLYAVWGKGWGGVELGCFFVCSKSCGESTFAHECGHGLQNCIWGPLFPFVIGFPSMIRYWLRTFKTPKTKKTYAGILTLCIILLGALVMLIPFTVFFIIGILIMVYAIIIMFWLFLKEIPQYADNQRPKYDDIWFEGQASQWGERYVATDQI